MTCRPDIRTCWLLHWFSYHAWSNDSRRDQWTNPKEQSPSWEAMSSPVSQEIPYILLHPKRHYHIHNNPPLVPIPSQINLAHNLPSYFFRICFNIILLFQPKSSKWSPSFRFPHQKPVCISLLLYIGHMPHSSHPPWLNHPTNIRNAIQIIKLLIMQFSPVSRHFLSHQYQYTSQRSLQCHVLIRSCSNLVVLKDSILEYLLQTLHAVIIPRRRYANDTTPVQNFTGIFCQWSPLFMLNVRTLTHGFYCCSQSMNNWKLSLLMTSGRNTHCG